MVDGSAHSFVTLRKILQLFGLETENINKAQRSANDPPRRYTYLCALTINEQRTVVYHNNNHFASTQKILSNLPPITSIN